MLVAIVLVPALVAGQPADSLDEPNELRQWRRKRPQVARIEVDGNTALSDRDILKMMQIKSPSFLSKFGVRNKPVLHIGAEDRDEPLVRRAYRRLGYWDATVAISAAPDPDDEHAIVTVFITENIRRYWGDIEIEADDSALVGRAGSIIRDLKNGAIADSLYMEYTVARIKSMYADRGHPRAILDTKVTIRQDTIDVKFFVQVGREVQLGRLNIVGDSITREAVVRREATWKPGELYSQRRLANRQQDIYASGLFTFVRLDPIASASPDSDSAIADFQLRVIERKPSYVGLSTGAGQDPNRDLTWDYSVEWGSRNWMGTARQWSLTARSGFVVVTDWEVLHHRFAASFTEPWPFDLHLPTTLTLAYEPAVRSPVQEYRVEKFEGEINVTRRIRRTIRWWSSLIYERVNIYDIPPERLDDYREEQGISIKRRFRVAFERDTRPNLFVPVSGDRTRIDMEYVGGLLGGSDDFYKIDGTWSRYQIISDPTVFASRVRLAWLNTHSNSDFVPTLDRFYLGGANSIRGYSENTVGPKDSTGLPDGGRVVLLTNLEMRTPMSSKFWFSIFADAGNNYARYRDMSLRDILVSVGVGLQYIAPVGPLRLDYARRVIHPDYPKSDRVHLSILFAF